MVAEPLLTVRMAHELVKSWPAFLPVRGEFIWGLPVFPGLSFKLTAWCASAIGVAVILALSAFAMLCIGVRSGRHCSRHLGYGALESLSPTPLRGDCPLRCGSYKRLPQTTLQYRPVRPVNPITIRLRSCLSPRQSFGLPVTVRARARYQHSKTTTKTSCE